MVYAAYHYAANAVLRDGASIYLRAIWSDDKQRLVELFDNLSSRSIYFWFFIDKQKLLDEELTNFQTTSQ